jgi:hypothetical protein
MAQPMAQAFGITVAGLMLHISQQVSAPHGVAALSPGNFILPFTVIGLASMVATLTYLSLPLNAGHTLHASKRNGSRRVNFNDASADAQKHESKSPISRGASEPA